MADWRKAIITEIAGGPPAPMIKNVYVPVRRKKAKGTHPCRQCGQPALLDRVLCPSCFKKKRRKRK